MSKKISLSDALVGEKVIVISNDASGNLKRRLLDIGLSRGTVVEVVFRNLGGNLTAYMIRGALIALRANDSSLIKVERMDI